MDLPPDVNDVHITVKEGTQTSEVMFGQSWHGTDGDHRVILASAILSRKTTNRVVSLKLRDGAEEAWQLDLASDPDPTRGYSLWKSARGTATPKIEMNFQLSADR